MLNSLVITYTENMSLLNPCRGRYLEEGDGGEF